MILAISIAMPFLALLLTLFTLCLNLDLSIIRCFRFLPPVRTYHKILEAIKKLKIESLPVDTITMQAKGETVFTQENRGFTDIVALLKRNQYIPNKASVMELRYWESYDVQKPPPFGLHLKCLNAIINNKGEFVLGIDALHQLKEMADIYVRGKITTSIIILAIVIYLLSVCLVVYANLC